MGDDLERGGMSGPPAEDVQVGSATAKWWGPVGPLKGVLVCIAAAGSGGICGPCADLDTPLHLRKGVYDHLAVSLPRARGIAVLQASDMHPTRIRLTSLSDVSICHLYLTSLSDTHFLLQLSCSSRGMQHLQECIQETVATVEWCRRECPGKAIGLLGHGVGGTVAVQAAVQCKRHVKGVVALSIPAQGAPKPEVLKKLKGEILMATGENDHLARPGVMQEMFKVCAKPKLLRVYSSATHELMEVRSELVKDIGAWATRTYNA